MKKLQRQISAAAIAVLLFAALAASFSLSAFLAPPDDTIKDPPNELDVVIIDPIIPLAPSPSGKPIIPLALAGISAILIPVSFSFAIEKMFKRD